MELDQAETNYSLVENKLLGFKEDLESMKVKETRQQYQYKVLEKEKDCLENTRAWTKNKIEEVTRKLEHSFRLQSVLGPAERSGILDDSGIDIHENEVSISSKRGPLDSGIFSPDFEKSDTFLANDNDDIFAVDYLRSLEAAVEKTLQIMSSLDKTFYEKTRLFNEKEKNFVNEISSLKKTVNHNDDIRSVLEKEIERQEKSQQKFQDSLKEKDKDLQVCQAELHHLRVTHSEKEKVVKMLDESVQEYQKRQEFLESKLDAMLKEIGQKKSEKTHTEETNQQYQKTCEELRQTSLTNSVASQKKIKNVDTTICELENQVRGAVHVNSQLRTACATLRKTTDQLNIQVRMSAARITELETQLKQWEEENRKAKERISHLSRELDDCKAVNFHLELTCKEVKQAYTEAFTQEAIVHVEMERAAKEAREKKEETAQLRLANTALKDELEVAKLSLKEKENKNKQFIEEFGKKNKLLKNNEAKLKTLGRFWTQINTCKERLERDIDQARRDNEELKGTNELLRNENANVSEEIKRRTVEIQRKHEANDELMNMNSKIARDLDTNLNALNKAKDELSKCLSQAESIENSIEKTCCLLECWPLEELNENLLKISKTQASGQGGRDADSKSLSKKLSAISTSMDIVFIKCQKSVVERKSLLVELTQQCQELKRTEKANTELYNRQKQLQDTVLMLSEKCSNLKDLSNVKDELLSTKKVAADLESMNSFLRKQLHQAEVDLSSYVKLSEDLRKEGNNLKEELVKAENELSNLKSKCEHLDNLQEELDATRRAMNEIDDVHHKFVIEKDDALLELQDTQKKLRDIQNSKIEGKQVLNETQRALEQERERITTVTKVARIMEKDLREAKMSEKLKDDIIERLKEQITQANEQTGALKRELLDVKKELITLRNMNETLLDEKANLKFEI